jgi:hypothetical protein
MIKVTEARDPRRIRACGEQHKGWEPDCETVRCSSFAGERHGISRVYDCLAG